MIKRWFDIDSRAGCGTLSHAKAIIVYFTRRWEVKCYFHQRLKICIHMRDKNCIHMRDRP